MVAAVVAAFAQPLNAQAEAASDVVGEVTTIIGGGLVGAATAYRLAASGRRVTLIDAGEPGRGTSSSSFAWLNSAHKEPRNYLVMAATLAEIKSRMLLPRPAAVGDEEADPRAELVRRLQEYERFKRAAIDIEELHRVDRDTFPASAELVELRVVRLQPNVSLQEMLVALKDVMGRAEMFAHHHISRERLSVRQRMSEVLDAMRSQAFVEFVTLFRAEEGRMGVTVTFIAILELLREGLIEIVQSEPYAPIHVRAGTPRQADPIDDIDDRAVPGPQGTEP